MTSARTVYPEIARALRMQPLPPAPVDHRWDELRLHLGLPDESRGREPAADERHSTAALSERSRP